jgi:hypothetical protein
MKENSKQGSNKGMERIKMLLKKQFIKDGGIKIKCMDLEY